MLWDECTQKFIRKVSLDKEKVNSIVCLAKKRLDFVHSISINKENVSFVFDDYYEIVKELLVALMLNKEMRSSNHQCLITFFASKYPQYEAEVNIISQMNYLRNRLDYYGESVNYTYFRENYKSFEEIIKLLFKLVK